MTDAPRPPRLILASASPARLKTLRAAGIEAEVIVSGVDESLIAADRPDALCATLARLKAEAVVAALATGAKGTGPAADDPGPNGSAGTLVLGCDSVLAFDGRILGKPADAEEAVARWRELRGRSGVLYTGHCVVQPEHARRAEAVAATTVHFADVTDREIEAYVATGEPLYVAGAFTIDGFGGVFVERIEGDAGTVIGLSLPLLRTLFRSLGTEITDFWAPASG